MITSGIEQFKKAINSCNQSLFLLYGNEPTALLECRDLLVKALLEQGELERFNGSDFNFSTFYDAVQTVSFFGGRRIILVEDFEPEDLKDAQMKELVEVLSNLDEATAVVLVGASGFDAKKGKQAKKLVTAASKAGLVGEINRLQETELVNTLIGICREHGIDLPRNLASFMVMHCGNDLGVLKSESRKLCLYLKETGRQVEQEIIAKVCIGNLSADVYSLAKLMIKGNIPSVLNQIDVLISQKQPAALILTNISVAFSDMARACSAKNARKTADVFAKDFAYKFPWRATNAMRDIAGLEQKKLYDACRILLRADSVLKSGSNDDRVIIDCAVIEVMMLFKRG